MSTVEERAMRLVEFYDLLAKHDWFYTHSDDHRVYMAGEEADSTLRDIARQSPAHAALYQAFDAAVRSGPGWGRPSLPLPPRPAE